MWSVHNQFVWDGVVLGLNSTFHTVSDAYLSRKRLSFLKKNESYLYILVRASKAIAT